MHNEAAIMRDALRKIAQQTCAPDTIGHAMKAIALDALVRTGDIPPPPKKTCHAKVSGKPECGKQVPHDYTGRCPQCNADPFYIWVDPFYIWV